MRLKLDRGSHLGVEWKGRGVSFKGTLLIALVVLTRGKNIRSKAFQSAFDRALTSAF